ncbi:RadC family protein [Thermoanaerobacterium thermosaccharolyticum]|uniref:DNA repair protein RadC n=3 Tax=Thermoanaerobacterium thermosaccharolyticum TaxID=1517 RepID=D9TP24_THETC|nr:DNA repair protein RadC [Thermoanaerobacterium thermosaccharolyticum]TCW41953.1 DNA replication and repair protein RadC [Thermohydrogenium kirishiense]ADL68643.1 DNA repair protein RadC [Thermoanaerobacterium thermosaccharolyticum DSM 571]AGB18727.1 DNA replication and repair protein RadC [Thermoanaerobacterium thermosaccharolyticum M0795]AST56385.1 DNA repair protein [Thermoanaerobacterium thermosaccharolyticum]KAA5806764.1 JAB domain-containing protein [Thermoanaerobacterium thermosacchar
MGEESRITIKDLPEDDRPRERLIKYGPSVLSNAELMAIIIGTGNRDESAIMLSQRLLSEGNGLKYLLDTGVERLSEIKGIGLAKAAKIKAAIELGRRLALAGYSDGYIIKKPDDVISLLMDEMRYLNKEYFKVVMLNVKNKVIAVDTVSIGSLNTSIVHPREVFKAAIERSASSIIMVHNHPSGDPTPSREDIEVSDRIFKSGNLLGIKVLDHIIIGDGIGISLKEKGYYDFDK